MAAFSANSLVHTFIIHHSNNDPIKYDTVKDWITRPRFNITYIPNYTQCSKNEKIVQKQMNKYTAISSKN